jgi:hypothetical protein
MRISVSCTERALGRRVSGSVAARCSVIARLRRLASTGAAWPTVAVTPSHSPGLNARGLSTRSEPMTSPPTSEGTHSDAPSVLPHTSQLCSGSPEGSRSYARPRRIARHERGVACVSASASPSTAEGSVLASSELPLALRVRTTASAPGTTRSARRRSSSFLELVVGALERLDVLAPLPGALPVAARLALDDDHAEGEDATAEQEHEAEHDPARLLQLGLGPPLEVAAQGSVLRPEAVHQHLARARVAGAGGLRPAALHLVDRDPGVRLPLAGGGGQRPDPRGRRAVVPGALDGAFVRVVELGQPQLVGLEEVAVAGQRVAAQPGLLVEHGGQQLV